MLPLFTAFWAYQHHVNICLSFSKRQINKPRPVSADDIEAIFRQAKEEQEKTDRAWEEEQEKERILNAEQLDKNSDVGSKEVKATLKSKKRSKKASEALESDRSY